MTTRMSTHIAEAPAIGAVLKATLSVVLAAALTACGGGGGDDASTSNTPPAAAPAATGVTLSGKAATGAAIANRPVDAKCSTGAATGSTTADGSYSLAIANGQWPCLARVTEPDGTVLHTVAAAPASAASATANITPATQLIVASLGGTDPAAYYAGFDATAAAAVTSGAIGSAEAAVIATLKAGGVDLTAAGDLIGGSLTPSTSTSTGDAYAAGLNAMASALTGSSLAALTTAVAATSNASVNGTPAASGTPSLPADVLLRTAAINCPALRSGS